MSAPNTQMEGQREGLGMSKRMGLIEAVGRKSAQLEALLVTINSGSSESLSPEDKESYLWLCCDLAMQVKADFDQLSGELSREVLA